MKSRVLNKIIHDLDETYRLFLASEDLPDHPAVRAGFFATAVNIIMEDPMDNQELQTDVMLYSLNRQGGAVMEMMEQVCEMFMKVNRGE